MRMSEVEVERRHLVLVDPILQRLARCLFGLVIGVGRGEAEDGLRQREDWVFEELRVAHLVGAVLNEVVRWGGAVSD